MSADGTRARVVFRELRSAVVVVIIIVVYVHADVLWLIIVVFVVMNGMGLGCDMTVWGCELRCLWMKGEDKM